MATPPTRVTGVTPAVGWTSSATPKTSPTFDVQSGDLIVLTAFSEDASTTISAPTWTGTGTWTLQQSIVISNYCTAYLYTCPVTATATGRTISQASNGVATYSFYASVWRNHGGLGVTGKTNVASGAPALTLATSANSAVVCGNSDWNAVSPTGHTWRTVNGSAMTETSQGGIAGSSYETYTGYAPDTGAAGNTVVGLLTPSTQKYSIVGAEVLGTSSASSFSGSVALSGVGTLATVASAPHASGSVGLSGTGSLTTSGVLHPTGGLTLSGTGTAGFSGTAMSASGSLVLSGSGGLGMGGTMAAAGSVGLSGEGTLTGSASGSAAGSVALSGSGSLNTTAAAPTTSGALALSGDGNLATSGTVPGAGMTSFSGSGSLGWISDAMTAAGSLALGSEGTLAGSGSTATPGAVIFSGSGQLSGTTGTTFAGSAGFSGGGSLLLSTEKATASGLVHLSGSGALLWTSMPGLTGPVQLSGDGALNVTGQALSPGAVIFSGSGQLAVSGTADVGTPHYVVATSVRRWDYTPTTNRYAPAASSRQIAALASIRRWKAGP